MRTEDFILSRLLWHFNQRRNSNASDKSDRKAGGLIRIRSRIGRAGGQTDRSDRGGEDCPIVSGFEVHDGLTEL